MAEVGGLGNVGGGVSPQNQNPPVGKPSGAPNQPEAPVGQPGALGQPTGIPVPATPGQTQILPDVLAGREASQMQAAERMRESGGASAIERLLGLDRQPSILGAFAAPPGNSEALRHMTPTMRRTIMRGLLDKQRTRMRRLARLLREQERRGQDKKDGEPGEEAQELYALMASDEVRMLRARAELRSTEQLLQLLDDLLAMQDYAISQMATFSQG